MWRGGVGGRGAAAALEHKLGSGHARGLCYHLRAMNSGAESYACRPTTPLAAAVLQASGELGWGASPEAELVARAAA